MWRAATVLSLLLVAGAPGWSKSGDAPEFVSFVACPVYRDTDAGPKSGCWLASDRATGKQYDVSQALTKPMIGKEILVEAVPRGASEACGGILLDPVHVSVLDTQCPEYLIPAEGYPGTRFELPAEVMQPTDVPRKIPQPPYDPQHFSIWFNFGTEFLRYQYSELILEKAALYANASKGRVTVTGFADTAGFSTSGRRLAEPPELARRRAEAVAEALRRLDVPAERMDVEWSGNPAPEGDLAQPSLRRVEIAVIP